MSTTTNNDNTGLEPFIPAWMFDSQLDSAEGWILAFLWRCRNSATHQCNPSAKTIALKTGLSTRKVFSCLKALAEKGLIEIQSGHSAKSNSYKLNVHGMHRTMHHMHTKVLNEVNTLNNNLGMHSVHSLPKDQNLGVLRKGELHEKFLKELVPALSPSAYRDYRVEVLGDGFASVINLYGGRTRKAIPA